MDIENLKFKWEIISTNSIEQGFKSVLVSSDCKSKLFLGINKSANRCLILSLPTNYKIDFRSSIRENLSIEFFPETNYIVLKLIENSFYELFDDLIISMYNRIKDIDDVNDYANEFIQTFYKWSDFFSDKYSNQLSAEAIKGLFGELVILKGLINEASSSDINNVLDSWTGPVDGRHDFTLDRKDLEIKTKSELKIDVAISSEYQLESNLDKDLELIVLSVRENEGYSIGELISDIKSLIQSKSGDYTLFLKNLNLTGVNLKGLSEYGYLTFKPVSHSVYSVNQGFPKLVRSGVPKEISSVKYKLRVSALDFYKISEIYY